MSEHDDFDDDLDVSHAPSISDVHLRKLEGLRGKDLGESMDDIFIERFIVVEEYLFIQQIFEMYSILNENMNIFTKQKFVYIMWQNVVI